MRVVVLGANGMLGQMMVKALPEFGVKVSGFGRDMFDVHPTSQTVVGTKLSKICQWDTDTIVNCIGAIKPAFNDKNNLLNAIYTNAILPHQIAYWGERIGTRVIHITTDCVFDGKDGLYVENSQHNATDEYGKSKSLGEPTNCMVIRTSIIGPEVGPRKKSLFEWVLAQRGKKINGYTNHFWNGLTTLELASIVGRIISLDKYDLGVSHLYSTDVSKFELVKAISDTFNVDAEISQVEAPEYCDRRLRTIKPLQGTMTPRPLTQMLTELKQYV